MYTLSSEPAIQRMQRELVLLGETITKQNEKITSLERKLGHLDSNIVVLESQLARSVIDSITQNEESKKAYDYVACCAIINSKPWYIISKE